MLAHLKATLEGVATGSAGNFDLILMDAALAPDGGAEACARLRAAGDRTPVLMIGEHAGAAERVEGLNAGADDYLSAPFAPGELRARIAALWRRGRWQSASPAMGCAFGAVAVDFTTGAAVRDGRLLSLSAKELQLLRYLAARAGATVSRGELLTNVWGYQSTGTRTVDVHIAGIRQKLEDDPRRPRHILTVRGKGYRFEAEAGT